LRDAGWNVVSGSKIRVEVITAGRIIGKNHKGERVRKKPLSCDYVLEYKGRRLAAIEAKARDKYYKLWEMTYPPPKEAYKVEITNWKERFREVPFALFKGLDAIAEKKDRLLLTMATGTGKTATAFHICWKLFHAKWNLRRDASRAPRILFLADRNILANQAFNSFNDFDTIDENIKKRISPDEIRKTGKMPKNGSIFFTIFQSFMTEAQPEEMEEITEQPYAIAAEPVVAYKKAKFNFRE